MGAGLECDRVAEAEAPANDALVGLHGEGTCGRRRGLETKWNLERRAPCGLEICSIFQQFCLTRIALFALPYSG
jgi:hypothetical protein